eukprot:1362950-Amorphochlora_amoeboformis.AAC.1
MGWGRGEEKDRKDRKSKRGERDRGERREGEKRLKTVLEFERDKGGREGRRMKSVPIYLNFRLPPTD